MELWKKRNRDLIMTKQEEHPRQARRVVAAVPPDNSEQRQLYHAQVQVKHEHDNQVADAILYAQLVDSGDQRALVEVMGRCTIQQRRD
jgi:hypothetical protein